MLRLMPHRAHVLGLKTITSGNRQIFTSWFRLSLVPRGVMCLWRNPIFFMKSFTSSGCSMGADPDFILAFISSRLISPKRVLGLIIAPLSRHLYMKHTFTIPSCTTLWTWLHNLNPPHDTIQYVNMSLLWLTRPFNPIFREWPWCQHAQRHRSDNHHFWLPS